MNQDSHLPPAEPAATSTAQVVHALAQFWRVVRHRQNVVLGCLAAALVLGALYYTTTPRLYQSKASLLVLQSGAEVTNTSMTPEGMRQGLMPTYERLLLSNVVLDGAGEFLDDTDRAALRPPPHETLANVLRQGLTAVTLRQTNIIEVGYKAGTPRAAVAVVNAVLRSYLKFMERTHQGTAKEVLDVLTREKVQLEQKLAGKEQEVLAARRRFGDLGIQKNGTVVHPLVQRAINLNEALVTAQRKRLELQAALTSVQAAIRNGEDLQQHVLTLENAVGREFLLSGLGFGARDATVQAEIEKQLLQDQAELTTLQGFYGPTHPKVAELAERTRRTEQYLSDYQVRVEQRLRQVRERQLGPMLQQMVQQRLGEAWQHENALRTSFEKARLEAVNLNGDLAQVEILEHDLKWLRDLRDVLLNQIANIDLKQDRGDIRTAVVSEPALARFPIWPRLSIVLAACLAGGLAVGLTMVYVLDILDDRFRSPEELRNQLSVPVLAMVRQLADLRTVGLEGVHAFVSPNAVESEAFRTLRTTLAFSQADTARIVVSSAEPGDGKTTVLANLAVSFAQSGKRTLLIDADMRRPGLTAMMGCKGHAGLADVLLGTGPIAEAAASIVALPQTGLDFLPAGSRRPNPAELLAAPRLADLLAWAESRYDQIFIDSPPALAASDSSIIGRLVDGLILVVQPKKNQRRLVMRAAESFTSVGITLLGVVVNRVSFEKGDSIYGYGGAYGYGYGYGYGYAEGEGTTAADDAPAAEAATPRPAGPPPTAPAEAAGDSSSSATTPPTIGKIGPAAIVPRRIA
jgi:capsular exopolysaccharide synthesis family protein